MGHTSSRRRRRGTRGGGLGRFLKGWHPSQGEERRGKVERRASQYDNGGSYANHLICIPGKSLS